MIDELASRVFHAGRVPRILFPHPAFDDEDSVGHQEPIRDLPTNAIPLAYARYLAHILGCEFEEGIGLGLLARKKESADKNPILAAIFEKKNELPRFYRTLVRQMSLSRGQEKIALALDDLSNSVG